MNLKIILPMILILLVGIGLVIASQIEGDVPIYKGWNLIYSFANPSQLDDWVTNDKVDIKAIYAFIPTTQEYARVYPNPEDDKIDSIGDGYLAKTSMWVYSDKETGRDFNGRMNAVEYNLEEPLPISEHQLYAGWNFLATIPGLEGKSINNIKGSCDIIKAYAWDAKNQEWKTLNLDEVAFYLGPLDPLWVGFVIKVSDNCKLETSTGDGTSPPGLPGDSQEESLSCTDSDGGLNYNVKGEVIYKQILTLDESSYSNILEVTSETKANLDFGGYDGLVELGKTYNSVDKDQTYTDDNQENILRDVPTTIKIKNINYLGSDNGGNSIEIEYTTTNKDECTSKYGGDSEGLIETSCTRHIDEFYRCPDGCSNGACIQ